MATAPTPKEAPAEEPKALSPAQVKNQVVNMVRDYMVPMSGETIDTLSKSITGAELPAFEEYIKTQAAGLYPTFAKQITSGISTHHLLEPYRQVGKQVLGQDFEPDFVGDPKSAMALGGAVDPVTNRSAPMSLDQWRSHLMNERSFGWEYTPAAHEAAQRVVEAINKGFTEGPSPEGK